MRIKTTEMKKCFLMFTFFVFMLLLAVLTENSNEDIVGTKIVKNELKTDNHFTIKELSDNVLNN